MINISENKLPANIIQEITDILANNSELTFDLDNLLFNSDIKLKIELIKKLSQSTELFSDDFKKIWSSILLEEAKKIK